jgi:hypothetical protein
VKIVVVPAHSGLSSEFIGSFKAGFIRLAGFQQSFLPSNVYTARHRRQNVCNIWRIICIQDWDSVPDSLRFLVVVACLAAVGYGAVWGLANFPPEQTEIVKPLPTSRLDN